jgi:hypothetical protein
MRGQYFAIEAKAPGEKLTPRQFKTKADIEAAHGVVLVIDGDAGVQELREWLSEFPRKH